MRGRSPILILGLGLLVGFYAVFYPKEPVRTHGPMPQEAYVWQRVWNEAVQQGVTERASDFEHFSVLMAEINWLKGEPKLTRVEPDWSALKAVGKSVGLAIRIGSYGGPFEHEGKFTKGLAELADSLIANARAKGVEPAEVQLDFDCAESKLAGYRVWVEVLRERVKPVPLTITALPSWLDRGEFKSLVQATDGFVLQVHALQRPATINDPVKLCEPAKARTWVEIAARTGVPFKVALPTYSYLTAFNREGKFIGASAEGPGNDWPPDVQTRELAAVPKDMAALMSGWLADRPAALQGVIWYRLPVSTDRWNWDWPTLAQIMRGSAPREQWRVVTRSPEAGLVEVLLENESAAKSAPSRSIRVQWQKGRLLAGDGLRGTQLTELSASEVEFQPGRVMTAVQPGDRQLLGWLRFDSSVEVQSELVAK